MASRKPNLTVVVSSDTHPTPLRDATPSVGGTRRSVIHDLEARLRDDRPDLFEALRENARREPTWGEKLVEFFRRSSFACGIALYLLAVAVGMYFAFQLGRGVL
jgi:hypothetical protein